MEWLKTGGDLKSKPKQIITRKNFASRESGATIAMKYKGVYNPKAILSNSKEEYLILPSCKESEEYELVINLSEDVAIDTILISNHEDFSD